MDIIDEKEFEETKSEPIEIITPKLKIPSKEDFDIMLEQMSNPIEAQKEIAVKIKLFLDAHINKELTSTGMLSDYTRRWVKDYNDVLDKIQKNVHGEKSMSFHVHKVTHSQIAAKVRLHTTKTIVDGVIKKK